MYVFKIMCLALENILISLLIDDDGSRWKRHRSWALGLVLTLENKKISVASSSFDFLSLHKIIL